MNSLSKFGGGAGIGSYVIVIRDGELQNVRAEVVRESYDKGENLYLSIIDDTTEEALLPLSGYVDNEGILHLSGRDFDDNKTYEFTVNNAEQTISVEEKEGVTIGETTIPTSGGGGGGTQLYKHVIRAVVSDLPEATEPTETTCVIVNASSTSFTTIDPGDWMLPDHYISGMVDLTPDGDYRHYSGIIQVTNESEPCFILCDTWGSPFKAFIGEVVSDTVTTL